MTATQAPTPGPLSGDDVKLLVKGDWLLPTLSGATPKQFDYVGSTVRDTPLLFFVDGGSCLASVANFIGRPDADGWMLWSGGEPTITDPTVDIEVRLRNGEMHVDRSPAFDWTYDPEPNPFDIIAFRLAPPAPVEASGSFEERALMLTKKHGNPVGTDYEQGQNDMGHRMVTMAREADAALAAALRPQPSGETR